LNTELQGVITKLENRQGTWTESDYSRDVLSGVYSSLPGSSAYTETFLSIERELYKKGGFYETTDLSNKFHLDVERKMKKFSEYAVDGGAYVYMDGRTVEVGNIDLDNLNAKPSTPSSTIAKQWEDPAYRGWYMLKYNEYVLDRVMGSPSNSVDNFDVWAANNTITQQEITDMAPYEHANADAEHQKTPPTYTKLDKAIIKAFEDAVDDLERDIPEFEAQKARDFLTATGVSARSTGILAVYVKNGTNYSKLFGMSSSVSQKTTKKAQQLVIRNLVERRLMRNEILANPDAYFADSVSWTQELKMKYPGIIKWPIIGSLIK